VIDLAPLLYVVRVTERSLIFLIRGLLLAVSVVPVISSVSLVDFPIVLLLLYGPLAIRLKESSLSFGSLNACVNDHEQIDHDHGLLHDDLLYSLDVVDSVAEGIDDLDILDIRDNIPGIPETFHVVLDALIMLLPDGL
jgi:hypothetical protein